MNKAAKIEEILAECLSDLERGDSIEDCLARYHEWREELQPLLRAAQRVSAAPAVAPSAFFRRHARSRLVEKIEAQATAKKDAGHATWQGVLSRLRRRVPVLVRQLATPASAAIVVILIAMVGIGTVYASADSLPGDLLYGVKLASERVQLTLSPAETTDARLYLRFARERLEEARQLAERGRGDDVELALAGYVAAVEAGGDIIQRQRLAGRGMTSLSRTLRPQMEGHQVLLNQIRERVGEDIQPAVTRAMAASQEAARRASEPVEERPEASPSSPQLTDTATPSPAETDRPAETSEPTEREEPVGPWQPPGQTKTPEPPGQTKTPQPPGQTKTPEPPGQTKTPELPGQTITPQPPGRTMTPQPPGRTVTPQPPGQTNTSQPPGRTMTPQPPGRTMTPEPPGPPDVPVPPGPPDVPGPPSSPRPPGGSEPGDA